MLAIEEEIILKSRDVLYFEKQYGCAQYCLLNAWWSIKNISIQMYIKLRDMLQIGKVNTLMKHKSVEF